MSRNNLAKIQISEKLKHIAFQGGWLKLGLFKNQIHPMKQREMTQMSRFDARDGIPAPSRGPRGPVPFPTLVEHCN